MKQSALAMKVSLAAAILACAGMACGQDLRQLIQKAPRMKPAGPVTFGTTQESFVTIPEVYFIPSNSAETYADAADDGTNLLRYATSGGHGFAASAQLPDGAVLTSLTWNLCDSSTMDQHWTAALAVCASTDGLCELAGIPLATTSNVGTPCADYALDISGLGIVVNNRASRLILAAVPGANDITNAIAGAVIGYKLQVSPAPATATFGDVPTNHPFFQYIEALAASGITGGCGNGNYCPDAPLTRGQMAVFMSKGLGLQWPLPAAPGVRSGASE